MAARLAGYLSGVQSMGERLIEPAPTQRDIREAERDAHPEHVRHLKLRFAEGIPRIISLQSVDLLTHIRRVEYQLRCFILWLAAILVEKAQNNLDFHRSLFRDSQETAQAQGVEPQAKNQPEQISDLVWKQELEMRRLTAKTYPIGGFSIITPVIDGKRRARRSRMRHLTPDSSRMVDASYLVARLARLPRILARADQMAERMAKRALSCHPVRNAEHSLEPVSGLPKANGNNPKMLRFADTGPYSRSHRHAGPGSAAHHSMLRSIRDDIPTISVSLARTPPPNPLYFEPFTRAVPPDKLWNSTEDDEERGDMTWLHFIASDILQRTGFAPGPDAGSCLPDFSRFEPAKPPQVRCTI